LDLRSLHLATTLHCSPVCGCERLKRCAIFAARAVLCMTKEGCCSRWIRPVCATWWWAWDHLSIWSLTRRYTHSSQRSYARWVWRWRVSCIIVSASRKAWALQYLFVRRNLQL